MFEVESNLWLQAFHAGWFAEWMRVMSWLGEEWFYMPAMLVLLFGIRLRPAMGVLLALVLVGAATDGLKQGFGLPRPSEVDARVLDKGESDHFLVADGGAGGFWELPAPEAVAAARAQPEPDYGFVSGHTSAATVLVLAIALSFGLRNPWGWAFVAVWPLLMGISRMYLGRHFLGDVVGGLAVGVIGAFAVCTFLRRVQEAESGKRTWNLLAAAMSATVAACLLPWVDPRIGRRRGRHAALHRRAAMDRVSERRGGFAAPFRARGIGIRHRLRPQPPARCRLPGRRLARTACNGLRVRNRRLCRLDPGHGGGGAGVPPLRGSEGGASFRLNRLAVFHHQLDSLSAAIVVRRQAKGQA